MEKILIIHDVFNNCYLQYFDPNGLPSDMLWTDVISQAGFYQESDLKKILELSKCIDNEVWIEVKTIYHNQ
jgi:hypothetical protein